MFGLLFSATTTSAPAAPDVATPAKSVDGAQHPSASPLTPSSLSAAVFAKVPANNGESPAPIDGASSHPQPLSVQDTPTSTKANVNNLEILPDVLHVNPTSTNVSSSINIDVAQPSISSPQPDSEASAQNDVAMRDGTSGDTPSNIPGNGEAGNDEDLPGWLVPMMGYLRSVAEDTAWQDLVTEFVKFEKSKPPPGVSFRSC